MRALQLLLKPDQARAEVRRAYMGRQGGAVHPHAHPEGGPPGLAAGHAPR